MDYKYTTKIVDFINNMQTGKNIPELASALLMVRFVSCVFALAHYFNIYSIYIFNSYKHIIYRMPAGYCCKI